MGVKPSQLTRYIVNGDINPDVPPLQEQLRRKPPALQEIERRHVARGQEYGNLESVPPGEAAEWASPMDIVPKPGGGPP